MPRTTPPTPAHHPPQHPLNAEHPSSSTTSNHHQGHPFGPQTPVPATARPTAGLAPGRYNSLLPWRNRRAKYETWLASPDAFVLAAEAEADDELVGYAMARVKEQQPGSWERGAKTGVLESLSVRADQRGGGTGTRLFEAVRAEFVKRGAREFQLDVIAGNADAIRFYTRQGIVPYVTTLVGRS